MSGALAHRLPDRLVVEVAADLFEIKDESALGDPGEKPGPAQGIQGSLNEARRADGFRPCLGTGHSLFNAEIRGPKGDDN